tara:strand:+ start:173 stop:1393 length:1221 start_codon:yes stop_codon:yes gene_type:complete
MLKKFIKNNLTISSLIFLSFLITIINFFRFFRSNSSYQFDPWLSNYQGGFVRRGIPGEFFYKLYQFFDLNLAIIALIFVSLLYFFFYFYFFKILAHIKLNKLLIFLIFSPLSFYFPILNSKATGHKEVIFLFFLACFCYYLPKINKKKISLLLILMIIIISGLSYEILLLYIPYLVIPYIYFTNFNKLNELIFHLITIGLVTLILIFLNFFFKGNENQVLEICKSIKSFSNINCFEVGKIADLKLTIQQHTMQKGNWNYGIDSLYASYFKIYFIGFIIGFFPLIYLFSNSNFSHSKINLLNLPPILILFFPFLFLFPIFYMGADWGRYMYIAYMSSLIITLFLLKNNILIQKKITFFNFTISKPLFVIIIFIYCFGWTVPICCEKNFKPGFAKVVERIILYYNPKK